MQRLNSRKLMVCESFKINLLRKAPASLPSYRQHKKLIIPKSQDLPDQPKSSSSGHVHTLVKGRSKKKISQYLSVLTPFPQSLWQVEL